MRPFLLRALLFFALQAVPLCLFLSAGLYMPADDFFRSITIKEDRFAAAESPRLIMIGGSNLPFGIDSAAIERDTRYQPVNMGLNYGLGYRFMVNQARTLLGDSPAKATGDVVLMSIEYIAFSRVSGPFSIALTRMVIIHPPALRYLDVEAVKVMLDGGLLFIGDTVRGGYTRFRRGSFEAEPLPRDPGLGRLPFAYSLEAHTKYGCIMPETRTVNIPPATYDIDVRWRRAQRVVHDLNAFDSWLRAHNARLVFYYSPTFREFLDSEAEQFARIESVMKAEAKFPILNTPEEARFELSEFFDSPFHLTQQGTARRTRDLIERLNALDSKPVP